jgi:hypothetical protein
VFLFFPWQAIAQVSTTTAPSKLFPNCGLISGSKLKCAPFGFIYRIPFGWVDRTSDLQQDADANPAQPDPAPNNSQTLLAIFERPPGAPGETINSAVVIAAENLASYRGIKTAADYFGPIGELAEQRGFKVVNEPQEFVVGTKHLVRGDFSKDRGKLTMWQSSLTTIEKGYIVSFTFVGGSEEEVEGLIENLSFGPRLSRTPAPAK